MGVKLLAEHHLELPSLKGDCTGLSESTLVKIPHCWRLKYLCSNLEKEGLKSLLAEVSHDICQVYFHFLKNKNLQMSPPEKIMRYFRDQLVFALITLYMVIWTTKLKQE